MNRHINSQDRSTGELKAQPVALADSLRPNIRSISYNANKVIK